MSAGWLRVMDSEDSRQKLEKTLDYLRVQISGMEKHRGELLLDWLQRKVDYILQEDKPVRLLTERGRVVYVDFGFNVGSEEGGRRPAVVLWNAPYAKTITVAPITSYKPNKAGKDLRIPYHVNLGEHLEDGIISVVKVQQMRAVSKLRVRPLQVGSRYKTDRLTPAQLDQIDRVIMTLFTGVGRTAVRKALASEHEDEAGR